MDDTNVVREAIKSLASKSTDKDVKPHEAMQLTQSALNLAHVLTELNTLK